jgi:hypothetical protein
MLWRKRNNKSKRRKRSDDSANCPLCILFFLNPYTDARFTRCPQCDAQTKVRKKIFVVHIEPGQLANLNMSGRYCPDCDLMILHQDIVENMLAWAFSSHNPDVIGNEYLIMGTLERKAWKTIQEQPYNHELVFDNLHVFKKVVKFEPQRYIWAPDPAKQKDKPE